MWFGIWAAWDFQSPAEYLKLCQLAVLPFFLLFTFFYLFQTPTFSFSCFLSSIIKMLQLFTTSLHFCCTSWSLIIFCPPFLFPLAISLSVAPACSPALSKVPLSQANFLWGFLKGHRVEETFCSTCLSDVVQCKKSVKTKQNGRRRRTWRRLKGDVSIKWTKANFSWV